MDPWCILLLWNNPELGYYWSYNFGCALATIIIFSAAYLENDILFDEGVKRLSSVRFVAGKALERKQKSFIYTNKEEAQKGVPAGEYMVYNFTLKFQAKNHIIEIVTIMLEKDNIRCFAEYFID